MTTQSHKQLFLTSVNVETTDQALRNCRQAAFRRNRTYADRFSDRGPFQDALTHELQTQSEHYRHGVDEDTHTQIIEDIADRLS